MSNRKRRNYDNMDENEQERRKSIEIKKAEAEALRIKIMGMLDEEQKEGFYQINNNALTLITGPYGSGKSCLAVAWGALNLKLGKIKKIYISRPLFTETSEQLGYMKGDKDEKMMNYMNSLLQNFENFFSKGEIECLIKNGQIELLPTMFIKGITIRDKELLIADEFQNANFDITLKVCSRIGIGGKLILISDYRQIDLRNKKDSGLFNLLGFKSEYFGIVNLSFGHRHEIVEDLLRYYDDLQNKPEEDRVVYKKLNK